MLALREALDIDPDCVAAFEALVALTTASESWTDLEEALLARSTRVAGVERRALLFRLAENARDRLEDADRAMGYLRQILDDEPGNAEAAAQMEKLLGAAERWHDLVELIEARAEAAKAARDVEGERRERLRVAEIWAEKLDSPDSACEAVEAIVKSDPRHLPSLITLGGLYARAGRHAEAIATLQRAAAARPTGRTAAELYHRLAQALQAQQEASGALDDEAIEKQLLAAVDADRTHLGALRALEDLSRRRNKPAQLVQVLELLERFAEDDDERVAKLKEIVALYSGPLGKAGAAMPALERLVALAPGDLEAREAYGSVLVRSGRAAEGQAVLNALLDELTKKRQMKAVARIRTALGQGAEARGDLPAALEQLQAAFKIEPAQPAILAALGRVAEASGDLQTAMRCYRALLLQTFDEAALGLGKADIYYALGRLHVAAREPAKAKNMFERGLEAAPSRGDIKAALAQLG